MKRRKLAALVELAKMSSAAQPTLDAISSVPGPKYKFPLNTFQTAGRQAANSVTGGKGGPASSFMAALNTPVTPPVSQVAVNDDPKFKPASLRLALVKEAGWMDALNRFFGGWRGKAATADREALIQRAYDSIKSRRNSPRLDLTNSDDIIKRLHQKPPDLTAALAAAWAPSRFKKASLRHALIKEAGRMDAVWPAIKRFFGGKGATVAAAAPAAASAPAAQSGMTAEQFYKLFKTINTYMGVTKGINPLKFINLMKNLGIGAFANPRGLTGIAHRLGGSEGIMGYGARRNLMTPAALAAAGLGVGGLAFGLANTRRRERRPAYVFPERTASMLKEAGFASNIGMRLLNTRLVQRLLPKGFADTLTSGKDFINALKSFGGNMGLGKGGENTRQAIGAIKAKTTNHDAIAQAIMFGRLMPWRRFNQGLGSLAMKLQPAGIEGVLRSLKGRRGLLGVGAQRDLRLPAALAGIGLVGTGYGIGSAIKKNSSLERDDTMNKAAFLRSNYRLNRKIFPKTLLGGLFSKVDLAKEARRKKNREVIRELLGDLAGIPGKAMRGIGRGGESVLGYMRNRPVESGIAALGLGGLGTAAYLNRDRTASLQKIAALMEGTEMTKSEKIAAIIQISEMMEKSAAPNLASLLGRGKSDNGLMKALKAIMGANTGAAKWIYNTDKKALGTAAKGIGSAAKGLGSAAAKGYGAMPGWAKASPLAALLPLLKGKQKPALAELMSRIGGSKGIAGIGGKRNLKVPALLAALGIGGAGFAGGALSQREASLQKLAALLEAQDHNPMLEKIAAAKEALFFEKVAERVNNKLMAATGGDVEKVASFWANLGQ
jgi:hypothetical protein